MNYRNLAALILAILGSIEIFFGFGLTLLNGSIKSHLPEILGGGCLVISGILLHKREAP